MRRSRTIFTLLISAVLLAGCGSVPASHRTHSPTPSATASAHADAAAADHGQLPPGVPAPPDSSDYNMDKPAGKKKYLAALKAWHDALTPAQKHAVPSSLGVSIGPEDRAELDWFNSLDPGVRHACIQLPFTALVLASLSIPGTSETPPDSITGYAKTIADLRDLQVDTPLRHILDSMATQLRSHARDTPPIDDPVLNEDISQMGTWIDANCTMPD